MSIPLTEVVYPHDQSGLSPSNKILNERHELTTTTWSGFNLVIPKAAPFFDDSFDTVTHYPSGRILKKGSDWITGWMFQSAVGEIGKFISSCIYIFDTNLKGYIEIPSYQCLGGEWQINQEILKAILAEKLLNPQRYYWEYVAKTPNIYRPLDHDQDIDEFSELGLLLDELKGISNAIRDTPYLSLLQQHMAQRNPHGLTKADLVIEKVMNWAIASALDLANPNALPVERYMNPPMTMLLINSTVGKALTDFMARRDNPLNVRAGQTGAFTKEETLDLITQSLTGNGAGTINAGTLEYNTLAQVLAAAGRNTDASIAVSRSAILNEVYQTLAGFQAQNTSQFADKSEAEWLEIINAAARRIAEEENNQTVIPSLDEILQLAQEPQTPAEGEDPIFYNDATLDERVKLMLAEYIHYSSSDGEAGPEIIWRIDGISFHIIPGYDDVQPGAVHVMGDATRAKDYNFFTDLGGTDGQFRLWVETPPARWPSSVFNLDWTTTTVSDGITFYGPSSGTQYTHPGRKNIPVVDAGGDRTIVDTTVTIPANDKVEYNLTTLLANAGLTGLYRPGGAVVYVRVENADDSSVNKGSWQNAEAICSYGLRANLSTAFVHNHSGAAAKVYVRVSVPKAQ